MKEFGPRVLLGVLCVEFVEEDVPEFAVVLSISGVGEVICSPS
jgi:hypothetical protein